MDSISRRQMLAVTAAGDPHFTRVNFCSVIRASAWRG